MASYRRPDRGTVTLAPAAEATLRVYASGSKGAAEGGGVLLGRLVLDSNDIMVDTATEPGPKDKRRPFSFERDKTFHQDLVNRAWATSNGTTIYLGGWHTHPEPVPTPSDVDIKDWIRTAKKAAYEQDCLIFAIAGTELIRLWQISRAVKHPLELKPLST